MYDAEKLSIGVMVPALAVHITPCAEPLPVTLAVRVMRRV